MKHLVLIIAGLAAWCVESMAQAPGYLGKRIELGLTMDVLNMPFEMRKADVGSANIPQGIVNLKAVPGLYAGISFHKGVSAFVSHSFTGLYAYERVEIIPGELASGSGSLLLDTWIRGRARSTSAGFKFHSTKRGAIAPIGPYFSLSLNRLSSKIRSFSYATVESNSGGQTSRLNIDLAERYNTVEFIRQSSWALGMGFGNSWVIAQDKFKIGYEVLVNLHVPTFFGPSRDPYLIREYTSTDAPVSTANELDEHLSWQPLLSFQRGVITHLRFGMSYLL